jgi:hypothetical protein
MRLEEGSEADPHQDEHQSGDPVSAVCVPLFGPECANDRFESAPFDLVLPLNAAA